MSLFEQRPEIASFLVHLYDSQRLQDLARGEGSLPKAELSNVMADLLKLPLSEEERELVADILGSLMRQAELDLRRAVAERLAAMEGVPLRVALQLANDEIEVADPVLRKSPVLKSMDLLYIIKSRGLDHWRAIARRELLSPEVIDVLADTRDEPVALSLCENNNLSLTPHALDVFAEMAGESATLARPLVMREDLPPKIVKHLYKIVGNEIRALLEVAHEDVMNHLQETGQHRGGYVPSPAGAVLDDILLEFEDVAAGKYLPDDNILHIVRRMEECKQIRHDVIVDTIKRGQIPTFIALFSSFCALSVPVVEEILMQESGQGLAVACKAKNFTKSDFVNFYLLTHRMRSPDNRLVDHAAFSKAIRYYDTIDTRLAERILNQSRH